ncbi:MAG: hypothetical protein FJ098_12670, partial [Deltaproteobacteria bacterium]|nr:hypothetical protein [Deltaproteobacteria bacterium]
MSYRDAAVLLGLLVAACTGGGGGPPPDTAGEEQPPADTPAAATCPWTPEAPSLPPLHVDGDRLRDVYGRTVLLRGINAGNQAKKPPHLPW